MKTSTGGCRGDTSQASQRLRAFSIPYQGSEQWPIHACSVDEHPSKPSLSVEVTLNEWVLVVFDLTGQWNDLERTLKYLTPNS